MKIALSIGVQIMVHSDLASSGAMFTLDPDSGFEDMEAIGRMRQPEEVATVATWLCSDDASFVTGNAMAVDGDWVAQ